MGGGEQAASLGKLRLGLARNRSFPAGGSGRGYELPAPLGDDGRLDLEQWDRVKKCCTRRRFLEGEDDAALPHLETQVFKVNE